MANRESSRRVARAQAAGSRTRARREIPVGFYSALAVIVVAGVASIGYSKYELDRPAGSAASPVQPAVGSTSYTAIGFDGCGSFAKPLAASSGKGSGISSIGKGVLKVHPATASEAGSGANLAAFIRSYKGLSIFGNGFKLPGQAAVSAAAGCHGSPAVFGIYLWSSLLSTKPTLYTDPAKVLLKNDQVITVAVVPKGAHVPQPPTAANLASVGAG